MIPLVLVAHVFVALADNDHQGIVKVHAHLGNGQDPKGNLYWGARYGVATYLPKDAGWKRVSRVEKPAPGVLERIVFEKKSMRIIADAYDGREIKRAIEDFTRAAAGHDEPADLVAYVGHDGLMEFEIDSVKQTDHPKPAIVLACISKTYFASHLAKPILLTTSLMAPEAYTLEAAITAHFAHEDVREKAAAAYCKYQKCSLAAGRAMFTSAEKGGSP